MRKLIIKSCGECKHLHTDTTHHKDICFLAVRILDDLPHASPYMEIPDWCYLERAPEIASPEI